MSNKERVQSLSAIIFGTIKFWCTFLNYFLPLSTPLSLCSLYGGVMSKSSPFVTHLDFLNQKGRICQESIGQWSWMKGKRVKLIWRNEKVAKLNGKKSVWRVISHWYFTYVVTPIFFQFTDSFDSEKLKWNLRKKFTWRFWIKMKCNL